MKRWNHFAKQPYEEDADEAYWMILIYRNYEKVVRILVGHSKDLKCLICADLSLNYKAPSSLAEHYYTRHKRPTAKYFLNNIMIKSPEELEMDVLNQKKRIKMSKQKIFPKITEELCCYCKLVMTFRTDEQNIAKCILCDLPVKKKELIAK